MVTTGILQWKNLLVLTICTFNLSSGYAKPLEDLIRESGYRLEVHSVTTSDGYILQMHRIPGKDGKPPVLLQHGLMGSSAEWVLLGPGKALAYLLADLGYDVWMANSRGNPFSRKHVTMSPDAKGDPFWDFSWHEIGVYDLPAQIDQILNRTRLSSLFYVGFAQGTTELFVMGSERPEYNVKIKAAFALAPTAYFTHAKSVALKTPLFYKGLEMLYGTREFSSENSIEKTVTSFLCKGGWFIKNFLCFNNPLTGIGFDLGQMQGLGKLIPNIFSYWPVSTSVKLMVHYGQVAHTGRFQQYDYGKENMKRYGSKIPPQYNLHNVMCPIVLYYSLNDYYTAIEDVNLLYSQLGHPMDKIQVKDDGFKHHDFIFSENAKMMVYDDVLSKLKYYAEFQGVYQGSNALKS